MFVRDTAKNLIPFIGKVSNNKPKRFPGRGRPFGRSQHPLADSTKEVQICRLRLCLKTGDIARLQFDRPGFNVRQQKCAQEKVSSLFRIHVLSGRVGRMQTLVIKFGVALLLWPWALPAQAVCTGCSACDSVESTWVTYSPLPTKFSNIPTLVAAIHNFSLAAQPSCYPAACPGVSYTPVLAFSTSLFLFDNRPRFSSASSTSSGRCLCAIKP